MESENNQIGASAADKSLWLVHLMENDPEAVELRDRTNDWAGSYSFGLLKHANFTSCSAHLDRARVLELIYQHLHSIGMHEAAFTLAEESQNQFQRKDQQFDRTDLRLLISMSLGPRDNLWDNMGIENTVISQETYDIDNYSVHYVEPLADLTEDQENASITYIGEPQDFSHIQYAPLHTLIRILTGRKDIPHTKDDQESFFLLLNTMCKSSHFIAHIESILSTAPDAKSRQKIFTFVTDWARYSSPFIGTKSIQLLSKFLTNSLKNENDNDTISIITNLIKEIKSPDFGKRKSGPVEERPEPDLASDLTKLLHPDLTLADPQPVEMARQISLAFHEYYSAISPREFYSAISTRELSQDTLSINEMIQFGHQLKYLIAATILSGDGTKAKDKMKTIVSIAEELINLHNYEALSWFVSAFDMSCLKNLSGERELLDPEAKANLEKILFDYDYHKQSSTYEDLVNLAVQEHQTAIPSIRYELSIHASDLYGGDDFSANKINWEKRQKAAELIKKLSQFQNSPYNFHKIGQIQNLLHKGTKMTKEDLNKASIQIESPIKPDSPEEQTPPASNSEK